MADISAGGVEFRAGRVISRTFSTYFRNFVPFVLFALVITAPTAIYTVLVEPGDSIQIGGNDIGVSYGQIIVGLVGILLGYLVIAGLVYGTLQDLKNNKVSIGECFSQGLARMFPALGLGVLSGILTGVAFIFLIIPGIMVMAMLWVTIPVVVTERRGVGSLGRSMELTKGYRWRVFFVAVMMFAILFGAVLLVGAATAAVVIGGGGDLGAFVTDTVTVSAVVMDWILSALMTSFMAVVYAVSYHDLRVAKEGVDSDQIAAVFD